MNVWIITEVDTDESTDDDCLNSVQAVATSYARALEIVIKLAKENGAESDEDLDIEEQFADGSCTVEFGNLVWAIMPHTVQD